MITPSSSELFSEMSRNSGIDKEKRQTYIRIQILNRLREYITSILRPMRTTRELVDNRRCEVVI